MNIYYYSRETGEFMPPLDGTVYKARPNPIRPDDFIYPAFATTISPPDTGLNEVAIFDGEEWSISDDFRGVKYYLDDEEPKEIENIGDVVPESATLKPKPTPPVVITRFSSLVFLSRFTPEAQISIVKQSMVDVDIKIIYDKMIAANFIDVTDEETIAGVDFMINIGVVLLEDKDKILATEVFNSV